MELNAEATNKGIMMTLFKTQRLLEHGIIDQTHQTAKVLGWKVNRGLKVCKAHTEAKTKQKFFSKHSDHDVSKECGEHFFLDISTIKGKKDGALPSKKNWRTIVKERTQTSFSGFFAKKNNMVDPTCIQVKKWKDSRFSVKYMQCDNAAQDTPQRNHLAKLKLALLTNKGW
eukprot:13811471-Ditylum_brightwellii.AAC.1